ncbi:hypothetical protein F4809DRAFT_491913 [Biscogniauxia mediterranea]|nr:hypothetical protein F4809DRAFT_491913 [Biscogniauxia mediterranea]
MFSNRLTLLITAILHGRSAQYTLESLTSGRQDPQPALDNSLFLKRDACSDAFGAGTSNSICAPSSTLCCVRDGQQFPSCQQFQGRGWCCVGSCSELNSVTCTSSGNDTQIACCPEFTTCVNGYNVRCQISYTALQDMAMTTKPAIGSSTKAINSVSVSVSASTSVSPSSTKTLPTPSAEQTNHSSGISSGTLAGSVVGAVVGVLAAAGAAFYFVRRRWNAKETFAHKSENHYTQARVQDLYPNLGYPKYELQAADASGQRLEPIELDGSRVSR